MSFIWMVGGAFEPFQIRHSKPPGKIQPIPGASGPEAVGEEEGESGSTPEFSQARKAYAKSGRKGVTRRPALLARDIMTSPVISLPPSTDVKEALEFIRRRRFRHFPVVAGNGQLVGILSDRDLLRGTPHPEHTQPTPAETPSPRTVQDLMSTQVLTATLDTPIREIARVFVGERISCLPILNPDRDLLGILTTTDILRCLVNVTPLDLWI